MKSERDSIHLPGEQPLGKQAAYGCRDQPRAKSQKPNRGLHPTTTEWNSANTLNELEDLLLELPERKFVLMRLFRTQLGHTVH